MKRQSIANGKYKIKPPKSSAFAIETSADLPKMHQLAVAVAKRGGGKTVALHHWLKLLEREKRLDRLFVITPTWGSNEALLKDLPVNPDEDVYHDPDDPANLEEITGKIKEEQKQWMEYERRKDVYRQLRRALQQTSSDKDIMDIDPELLMKAHAYDGGRGPKGFCFWVYFFSSISSSRDSCASSFSAFCNRLQVL